MRPRLLAPEHLPRPALRLAAPVVCACVRFMFMRVCGLCFMSSLYITTPEAFIVPHFQAQLSFLRARAHTWQTWYNSCNLWPVQFEKLKYMCTQINTHTQMETHAQIEARTKDARWHTRTPKHRKTKHVYALERETKKQTCMRHRNILYETV